jgi:hypothetical protein
MEWQIVSSKIYEKYSAVAHGGMRFAFPPYGALRTARGGCSTFFILWVDPKLAKNV